MDGLIVEPFKSAGIQQAHSLAHAGADYLRAAAVLFSSRKSHSPNPRVELPIVHMAIELLAKAHAVRVDPTFVGQDVSHRTSKLIAKYSPVVPAFDKIHADANAMKLIEALESAWLKFRYGEAVVYVEADVLHRAADIAGWLADEHFRETNVEICAWHFDSGART